MIRRTTEIAQAADLLAKKLADDGKLIEAGWVIFKGLTIPPNAPEIQVSEMRLAFMAGSQHLFTSIIGILDPGEEPTDTDMRRMELINNELDAVYKELKLRYQSAKGHA
jgi:hypothetical protein